MPPRIAIPPWLFWALATIVACSAAAVPLVHAWDGHPCDFSCWVERGLTAVGIILGTGLGVLSPGWRSYTSPAAIAREPDTNPGRPALIVPPPGGPPP